MSETKVIWSGTYAGMAATVGGGFVSLDACRVRGGYVRDAILVHAVGQVATERDELRERLACLEADNTDRALAHTAIFQQCEELTKKCIDLENELRRKTLDAITVRRQHGDLRERLAKLENSAAVVCLVRDLLDGTGHELREPNAEFAALDRAIDDLVGLLQPLPQGAGDVET